jgi:hypothetical protein
VLQPKAKPSTSKKVVAKTPSTKKKTLGPDATPAQKRKSSSNKRVNVTLHSARKKMNALNLRQQVYNFIVLMHKKKSQNLNVKGSKRGYPWINYHNLSEEWFKENPKNNCLLPKIEGLNFVLRETSSNMLKREKEEAAEALKILAVAP